MKDNIQTHSDPQRTWGQVFLGRSEDPAFGRACRAAVSVVLILLLGAALRGVATSMGLIPDALPFSWKGMGEQLLVKPAGTFLIVLFLHLLRWLVRAKRRVLALTLVAATGPLCFCLFLLSFGWSQVFSRDVFESDAVVAWLVLLLVPAIFLGVVVQLEPVWIRSRE